MRWMRTGWPPASTMATATAKPAWCAPAVAASIIFLAPARVRRLLSATYIGLSVQYNRRNRRIFQHSRDASMKTPSVDTSYIELRDAVRDLCRKFGGEYWRKVDEERAYPDAFAKALTEAGWLAALIPEEYGGSGLSVTEASIILEEICRSGGFAGAVHGQMYVMGCVLRPASAEQKQTYLPKVASGELRMQSMAVTEPGAGTDTTKLKTVAVKKSDRYVVNGQKVFISRVRHSDLLLLLARTTPIDKVKKNSEGLSVCIVDLREAAGKGLIVEPIRHMA